jgi:hypothetical protein
MPEVESRHRVVLNGWRAGWLAPLLVYLGVLLFAFKGMWITGPDVLVLRAGRFWVIEWVIPWGAIYLVRNC